VGGSSCAEVTKQATPAADASSDSRARERKIALGFIAKFKINILAVSEPAKGVRSAWRNPAESGGKRFGSRLAGRAAGVGDQFAFGADPVFQFVTGSGTAFQKNVVGAQGDLVRAGVALGGCEVSSQQERVFRSFLA
jgi:hypothetical protein